MKTLQDYINLAESATSGEWVQGNAGNGQITVHDMTYLNRHIAYMPIDAMPGGEQEANARFITNSRTLGPAMAKALIEADEALGVARNAIDLKEPEQMDLLDNRALERIEIALSQIQALNGGEE